MNFCFMGSLRFCVVIGSDQGGVSGSRVGGANDR